MMELVVFFQDREVGRLQVDPNGPFCFSYAEGWLAGADAFPLSISLPLGQEPLCGDQVRNFFANILPEGDVRDRVARKLGVSRTNVFELLRELGGDCAGAISVYPPDKGPQSRESEYRMLDDEELAKIVAELPQRPLLAGEEGIRLSLAGAQEKLPIRYENGTASLPLGGAPSTHILKPPIRGVEESVVNEAFCMRLATAVGIDVPNCTLLRTGKVHSLLVERYDRVVLQGSILRVHQEDFCQAMGVAPEIKYENEGGPAFKECCELLRKHSVSPAKDLLHITEWMFFNVLIGNADAHAKNLSLLYRQKAPSLAPSYDLLCTTVYEGLSQRMAMKVGGENRPAWIMKRHWMRLAEDTGVKPRIILDRLQAFCARTEQELDPTLGLFRDEYRHVETTFASKIADRVRSNIRETLKRLSWKE